MTTFQFPAAYVWQRELPNHSEIKARVLPKIIATADKNEDSPDFKWKIDAHSSVITNFAAERLNPWEYFTYDDVTEIAFRSAELFKKSNAVPNNNFPNSFELKAFWWNRYKPGSTAPPHIHSGCISGIYLLEQTGECPLEFFASNPYSPDPEDSSTYFRPKVEEGFVLLFPGTLTHWVNPSPSLRTTISFNLAPAT